MKSAKISHAVYFLDCPECGEGLEHPDGRIGLGLGPEGSIRKDGDDGARRSGSHPGGISASGGRRNMSRIAKHFFRGDTGLCKCGLSEAEGKDRLDEDCPAKLKIQAEWRAKMEAKKWTPERAINIFSYRPRPGDIWEVKIPGKKKFVKTIRRIHLCRYPAKNGRGMILAPEASWEREPKAHYFGHRIRIILQYGTLLHRDPERLCNICCSDLDKRSDQCRNIHCEVNQ